jgi:putative serine protease PepD
MLTRLAKTEPRVWSVGVASGLLGALATAGILAGFGIIGTAAPAAPPVTQASVLTVPGTEPAQGSSGITALLDTVDPSVVGLNITDAQGVATGAGVIASMSGDECYVLTSSALFAAVPISQVQVTDYWGDVSNGALVGAGTDPPSGIAVVRVTFPALATQDAASVGAQVGTVADIQTGESVLAVGSSSVAGSSNATNFASGYISDTSTYLQPINGASDAMFSMLIANMTASSSLYGGPVVDQGGHVVGILGPAPGQGGQNAATSVAYVTPIDTAMADLTWMQRYHQAVAHPWLGVLQATDITGPAAKRFSVAGAVQVDTVASGSPAARAGIRDGDVITSLGGNVVSVGVMIAWLADARPGQVVSIAWSHDGHHRRADITLSTQPATANPS